MPPRRPPNKENARKRKASEDMTDDPPDQKGRYNLRTRKPKDEEETVWVDDDTLDDEEEDDILIEIPIDSSNGEDIIRQLFAQQFSIGSPARSRKRPRRETQGIPLQLTQTEKKYYFNLPPDERKRMLQHMQHVVAVEEEGSVPTRFKVLELPVSDHIKSMVLKKLDALSEMSMDSSGAYKLKTWVDGFLKIPFGKTLPLPVKLEDGVKKCTEFIVASRKHMDNDIYGMQRAKMQIMQILSQWVANPGSVGNVIALQGPPGIGKTSFAKNAIANVLNRPFIFVALGGASDIANFTGHSYTYEGSTWGRIVDALMQSGTMNPVFYFDELDKVSSTAHGDEIISMLIHLTDRTQNTQFHDRYFTGVDLDLSQCLFVFSFNDLEKVHPILRDRMNVIECSGYTEKEKAEILTNHIWPQLLKRMNFSSSDIVLTPQAITDIISEHSQSEPGVRNMIRCIETIITRINMLRVAKHESMKEYPFYTDIQFPVTLSSSLVKTLLKDAQHKKQEEVWRNMYT